MIDLDNEKDLPAVLQARSGAFQLHNIYECPAWYDIDYAGYAGDVVFYQQALADAMHVVELGAGTGRLTESLAYVAAPTRQPRSLFTAVEPSAPMRAVLQRRALAHPQLVVVDATAATFTANPDADTNTDISQRADAVVFAFNGLLHLHDQATLQASLAHIRQQVRTGGRFCFDVTGPYWDAMVAGGLGWGRVDERIHPVSGVRFYTADRFVYHSSSREMIIDVRFVCGDERTQLKLTQFMWTYEEILSAVESSGFSMQMMWGDVDGRPWSRGSSRLLCVACAC
jgi:SAM-dependent methyltransferase